MKNVFFVAVLILCGLTAFGAPPIKTVKGEYTFYGDGKTSPAECRRLALEGARLDALTKEFGTIVTQDVMQADRLDSKGEDTKFLSLSSTAVKGEWIADEGEPQFDISLDKDDNMIVHCIVKGKAREISNESVDFDALVLRNIGKKEGASTEFYDGDRLYLYFSAPMDGYVAMFLAMEDGNVLQMLPYLSDPKGEGKVKRGYDYIFFDDTKAVGTFGEPNLFAIECKDGIEFNKIYVIFSPSYFARPVMSGGYSMDELPMMKEEDFSKWLVKTRRNDPRLGVKQMNLKIYPR